ncbi:alpha-glucosidase/alpha-galactosidase [Rubellicoccus peritrichatus]|uniref:Alpha-glucosidase/alpha-galactosidase n=1 Tax=Rubellicoccus peritrichatus TaxID=3080537 RepID=A0AAQ3LDX4_9BACT|nr:alpha-glucosidase/alpha-galactosidase [Puniceicoccus sp. CR14]WOO42145.1 alpha-glucosidase/alpha-galactosidase [Puniceicoccus sp. CR14]
MSRKITLIGAGSVVFAKTLISDILQFAELSDSEICLMDIDPARLKVADIMMKRIIAKLGVKAKVTSTLEQKKAIKGAKYVICTVQVGGYKPSTVRDFEIPKKYGLQQTIADTLGVGGVFRALRTIPVINGIAQDIADHAHPDCLFLNYTNPMAMNCWAVDEAVGIPHVGLCHSVFGTARMLAGHVGIPYNDVSYLVAGINHMAFFLKFQYRGQDAYPLLYRALEDPDRSFELVRYEMMRRTGYFVTESSEHQSEYLPYFIHHGKEVIDKFNIPIDEYLRRCEGVIATWEDTEAKLLGEDGEIEVKAQSHEYGSYIIHSRETNTLRTVYGNVPNTGLITNLTEGCCVEVPCQVDASGLNPVYIGKLPDQLAAICMTNVNVQRLTVTAALTGKREHIYHAVMMDPHASSTLTLDNIWAMCDELIDAHQCDGYLGEFAPVIKNTGRTYAGLGDRLIARSAARGVHLDQAGTEFDLEVSVENPSTDDVDCSLVVSSEGDTIALASDRLKLSVPAGAKITEIIKATVKKASKESVDITLTSTDPRVVTIGSTINLRRRMNKADDGSANFALDLSGFPSASGSVSREGENLRIKMTVGDSDIKPKLETPWQGSSVELFFCEEGRPGITHLFVVPDKQDGVQVVDPHKNPVDGIEIELERRSLDYSIDVLVPNKIAGVSSNGPILFDAYANLNALGDAHSGGRSTLSGRFDSGRDMTEAYEAEL